MQCLLNVNIMKPRSDGPLQSKLHIPSINLWHIPQQALQLLFILCLFCVFFSFGGYYPHPTTSPPWFTKVLYCYHTHTLWALFPLVFLSKLKITGITFDKPAVFYWWAKKAHSFSILSKLETIVCYFIKIGLEQLAGQRVSPLIAATSSDLKELIETDRKEASMWQEPCKASPPFLCGTS